MSSGFCGERACPALGCEAAPKPAGAIYLTKRGVLDGAASQPSAGQARSPQKKLACHALHHCQPFTSRSGGAGGGLFVVGCGVAMKKRGELLCLADFPGEQVFVRSRFLWCAGFCSEQASYGEQASVVSRLLTVSSGFCGERACPALGCEAAPKPAGAIYLTKRGVLDGAASQPSAGQARSPQKAFLPPTSRLITKSSLAT